MWCCMKLIQPLTLLTLKFICKNDCRVGMYFDLWFFMTFWSWYHLWSQVESILVFNAQMVSFWLWQIKYIKTNLENFSWSVIHFQSLFTVEDASCSRKQEPRLTRVSEECSKVGADGRTDGIINDLDNITQEKLLKSISF